MCPPVGTSRARPVAIADVAGIQRGGNSLAKLVAMDRHCVPGALLSPGKAVRQDGLSIPFEVCAQVLPRLIADQDSA
jgi:hypothetical protein